MTAKNSIALKDALAAARRCTLCESDLPLGANPVLRATDTAKLLIIGQAPGTRVHASGVPWDDPSGERLRAWLGISDAQFYDEQQVAIVPMGFCYPGRGKSGDLPPDPRCAPRWHQEILGALGQVKMTLLVGQYAQRYYLPETRSQTLTARVREWSQYSPQIWPLPHPSPRNNIWLARNTWFEEELLPQLQDRVRDVLA